MFGSEIAEKIKIKVQMEEKKTKENEYISGKKKEFILFCLINQRKTVKEKLRKNRRKIKLTIY